jgi:sulfur carrier protein ThiS
MKITVKLFGTLGLTVPGYIPEKGLVLEIDEGSTVADLLTLLALNKSAGETVLCAGRLLNSEDQLTPGATLEIFQVLHGG